MGLPRRTTLAALLLALSMLLAGTARAHELGGSRFDAPVPLGALYAGGAAVVALSAVVSARTIDGSSVTRARSARIPGAVARPLRLSLRLGFLALFALVVVAGLVGKQARAENLATVVVWPLWIDGLALVAALVGSPWRVLSPWRTLYDGLVALEGSRIVLLGDYPARLDVWPAFAGFVLLVAIAENLTVLPRSPAATSVVLLALSLVMLLGGVAFGPTWFDRADPFAVFLRLFGRVAPVRIDHAAGGYSVALRAPWGGCLRPIRSLPVAALVVATVYTVSFDGFTSTSEYRGLVFGLAGVAPLPPGLLGVPLYVAGLLTFLAAFGGVVRAMAGPVRAAPRTLALAFAPTLLPISVAYQFAHYYPYVLDNLGLAVGLGWELLAGVNPAVDLLGWLTLPAFWASQVLFIVLGHVVAVVAAHAVASDRFGTARDAWLAHLPLVGLMIGYTVLSLWIVSRPVVSG